MSIELLLAIITVALLATFIKSAFGFGEGLVNMALLSFIVDLEFSVPFVALSSFFSSLLIVFRDRKDIHINSVKILLLGALFFVPLGILFAAYTDEKLMRKSLGLLIALFAAYGLFKPKLGYILDSNGVLGLVSGAVGGFLGGAYNISGPPVVIYANLRAYPPTVFRATLQGFFAPLGLYVTIGHWTTGHYNGTILYCFLWAIPMIFIGIVIGKWVNKQIRDPEIFRRTIYLILVILGITMLFF